MGCCCGKGQWWIHGAVKTERKKRIWGDWETKMRTLGLEWTSSYIYKVEMEMACNCRKRGLCQSERVLQLFCRLRRNWHFILFYFMLFCEGEGFTWRENFVHGTKKRWRLYGAKVRK